MAINRLYVANWKMYWTCDETLAFVDHHYNALCNLATSITPNQVVLCPTSTALQPLRSILIGTSIALGGQDCATGDSGAYTGQISTKDLSQLSCKFCIVGHSEQRRHCKLSEEAITEKCSRLLEHGITPIVCIGETADENEANATFTVLQKQLDPIINLINKRQPLGNSTEIILAYEPVWAIGTGATPTITDLENIFTWLSKTITAASTQIPWRLLYGGSVNSSHASQMKKIKGLDGFLIGGASLDFQEFEKIVKCN